MKNKFPLAKKNLGQHYLKSPHIIHSITQSGIPFNPEIIIEVGPGPGVLTQKLQEHAIPLWVIEKDERFLPLLENIIPHEKIITTDALTWDWNSFLATKPLKGKKIWLVSNLPYNISTPLFILFLSLESVSLMTLMFQKEVAEKILAREKNNMNSLGILAQVYFEVEKLCSVSPGAFLPPPKVSSMVLTFNRRLNPKVPLSEWKGLEFFIRKIFAFKRKQLGVILKEWLGPELTLKILHDLSPKVRSESLNLPQVLGLYYNFRNYRRDVP